MKYSTFLILHLAIFWYITGISAQHSGDINYVDLVNPYIGNVSHLLKPTHPVVHLPNSFLRVQPNRNDFTDLTLRGLPLIKSVDISLSPFQGSINDIHSIITYRYDHEVVTPYSYNVILDQQNTSVNLGVSRQSALYQFKFNGDGGVFIILNAENGRLKWNGQSISGYQILGNGTKAYVYLVPEQVPQNQGVLKEDQLTDQRLAEGKNASLVLSYPDSTGMITLRYGISFIDENQALKNMLREVSSSSIEQIQSEGRRIWNETLGKIQVEGGTLDEKMTFYTALYRSHYRPVSISEDGRYFSASDGRVHEDHGLPFYTDDAGWDTYRALHPLNALISPIKEEHILNSYLRIADQLEQFRMPKFIGFTGSRPGMISNHIILSYIDAYQKGLRNLDLEKAFEAGKNVVMQTTLAAVSNEPAGELNDFYQKQGYVPALWEGQKENILPQVKPFTKRMAVAVTLGTAYDDWGLAQMAKEAGKQKEFQYFCRRSLNYRKLFNSGTGFFHPRDKTVRFIRPIDYTYSSGLHGRDFYDESNGWIYRFGLQYNIEDLIKMMGGKDKFVRNLDKLFEVPFGLPRHIQLFRYHNQTGIVGHFSMGNEPSFHIPYLYNYAGQPWKTQKRIRMLTSQWFRNDLFGIPGDDDGGALSAYIVFSFMGFYPVTPGIPVYNIGSPVFSRIKIKLHGNTYFEILAENNSLDNKYIQSATLNGRDLDKSWFTHSDVLVGKKLVLRMGPRPNKEWGAIEAAIPPSSPILQCE